MYKLLSLIMLIMSISGFAVAQENLESLTYHGDGFSLAYSSEWTVAETDDMLQFQVDSYTLNIYTNDVQISIPAGEFERRQLIGFYGMPIDVLVYEGRVKMIGYGRLQTEERQLTIRLDVQTNANLSYEELDIPYHIIEDANWIVSTIRFTSDVVGGVSVIPFSDNAPNVIDSWVQFGHPTEPFGFRYPETWSVEIAEDQVILSRDMIQFVIAYTDINEEAPTVTESMLQNQTIRERAFIYGMFQAIPNQAIDSDEYVTEAVIYTPISITDNHFAMWLNQVDGGQLSPVALDEIDMIINTFRIRPPSAMENNETLPNDTEAEAQIVVHNMLGFEVTVPAGWVISENTDRLVLSFETFQLIVSSLPPSGLPSGRRITFTEFIGDSGLDIRRDHIIYEDNTIMLIYGYQGLDVLPIGDAGLFVSLIDTTPNYDEIDLSDNVITIADQIVASLRSE